MRYYLYQDRDAIKNIFGSLEDAVFDLETVEYIEERCDINAENGFFEAEIHEGIRSGGRIKGGIDGANSRSVTKSSEYGNLEDIKSIHQNRFYHKLIEGIKCSESKKIYFNKGKVFPYVNQINNVDDIENYKSDDKIDKFAVMGNTYLWLISDNILQDIGLIGNITDEVNTLGYIVKHATYTSPQIVKVLAMYIE